MKPNTKKQSANGQISKFANLLIFTLANLLIFTACSKSSDDPTAPELKTPERLKAWDPKPVVDTTQTYMPFLTKSEGNITLTVTANGSAWVDTNNNGKFDEGTDVKITKPAQTVTFTAPNKVFTVYGSVTNLNAAGNALTAADVANNPALTKLNVAKNNLNEAALTHLIASLPTATAGAAVVLRSVEEKDLLNEKVRGKLANKGWKPIRLNKEGVEEEDKEAPQPDPDPQPDPQPGSRDEVKEYIRLTTEKRTVKLDISAAQDDRKWVWIDLNDNGKWEEGIDIPVTNFGEATYTLKGHTFRIYGKVTYLTCEKNDISAIALHNPYLKYLSAETNKLQSLNIPDSDNLTILYLDFNPLKFLTLGNLPNLNELTIEDVQLSTLALGGCPKLKSLVVSGTPITQLNVSTNIKLNKVFIGRHNGKGLIGDPLKAFVESLHSNGGEIFLSQDQKTAKIVKDLKDKNWTVK